MLALKLLARAVSLKSRVRLFAAIVPPQHWFQGAILMSRWHARVTSALNRSRRGISEAYLRENWLVELSRLGPFPVPMRVSGAELLDSAASDRGGRVLCGTHLPLLMVMLRAAILSGHKPELAVADPSNIRPEVCGLQPTGLSEGVPAAPPGPIGLLRIRTILRNNGLVACTLDRHAGGPSHPDLLVLAGRLGARIITYRTELASDGVVSVSFDNAVHPYCHSYAAIEANIQTIQEEERRLLASLDGLVDSDISIAALSQPDGLTDTLPTVRKKRLANTRPTHEKSIGAARTDLADRHPSC
jgi:hypothetical protein